MELLREARRPVHWWVREHLPPTGRKAARRLVDSTLGPTFGSLQKVTLTPHHIAVTFDDGPAPAVTPRLLDALARRATQATFFLLVAPAERDARLVTRMVADGHEVALHGLDHRRLTDLAGPALDRHLREGRDRLEQVAGQPVRLVRPPFGSQTVKTFRAIRRAGLQSVVWSRDLQDWIDQEPEDLARRAEAQVSAGDIVLLHETLADDRGPAPSTTFDRAVAAEMVLSALQRRGLASTTVSKLIEPGRPVRTAWFRP